MQRVSTPTAVAQKPAYAPGGEPGFFTQGDPVQGLPATVPGQDFLNRVQEELVNAILAAGLTLDPEDDTQLLQAVLLLIAAHAPMPELATEEAAGISRRSTMAEALAGVATTPHITPAQLAAALAAFSSGPSIYKLATFSLVGR